MRELAQELQNGGIFIVRTALSDEHMGQIAFARKETDLPDWAKVPVPDRVPAIECDVLCERLTAHRELIICGGGHISKPVCTLGAMLGYAVTVIDERPEFAVKSRFSEAERVLCASFDIIKRMPPNASYVIVTNGHKSDAICLSYILQKPFSYCGMVGSKAKVHTVMQKMRSLGFSEQVLQTVHSPIGLKIGARTPEEIAVSIAAELIAVHAEQDIRILPDCIINKLCTYSGKMVMAAIIHREGSAPRGAGTRMLAAEDGTCCGTIGGGSAEHAVLQDAQQFLYQEKPEIKVYNLSGGQVHVLFTPIPAKNIMHTAAVILAAGFSRRMGDTDKLKLPISGMPMYQRSISMACSSKLFSHVIVVTNQTDITAFAHENGAAAIENPLAVQGQGTSVAAASRILPENTDFCMFLTADQPYLTRDILYKLVRTAENTNQIVVPRVNMVPKSPCIFPKRFFEQCKTLSGETGGKGIYKKYLHDVVWIDFADSAAWQDIDTAEDYSKIISGESPIKRDAVQEMP